MESVRGKIIDSYCTDTVKSMNNSAHVMQPTLVTAVLDHLSWARKV